MMLLALPIFLLSLLTCSKASYAAICQDSATKTDILLKQCPKQLSGERTYCYHVVMVNTTWGTKSKAANCSGYAVDLSKSKHSASDHKPSETYQLNRILAVFRNGTSVVNGTKGSNWVWMDRLHWECNCTVENAAEKNCTNILTASKIYECGTLPCGKDCSFLCKGFCKAHNFGTTSNKGIYKLKETRQDNKISLNCDYGPTNATMEATCIDPLNIINQWNISDKYCRSFYDDLLSQLTENVSTILNVTQRIEEQFNATELKPVDIGSISKILFKIANFSEKQISKNKEISERFYRIVNNVLDVNKTIISISNEQSDSSTSYIKAVETFAKKHDFPKNPGESRTIANFTNVIVTLVNAGNLGKSRLNFSGDANDTEVYGTEHSNTNGLEVFDIELSLPAEAFDKANSSNVVFILYRKTSFFKLTEEDIALRIRRYVIAASLVTSNTITNLTDPVVLRYPKSKEVDVRRAFCVFWNFINTERKLDGWSTDGCEPVRTYDDTGYDNCHCKHLTSFAMLLNVFPETPVPNKHKEILSLLSYIGCSLSFLGIILILLTMFIFKELLASTSSKIFLNICIALGAALGVFLVAAERKETFSDVQCIAAGMLNHFLFLVAFAWMVLEAYTMFFAFVKLLPKELFEAKIPRIWISCLICWGIPGVIVGITAGITLGSYANDEYCLLQGFPAVLAFLIPVALCVSVNTISFVFIFRSLMKSGSTITSTKKTTGIEQARRGAAISVYLGLTWIFGLFGIGDAKLYFQYLFCIFNSFQGFMIFLFYCVFSVEVRAKYRARFFNSPPKRSKLHDKAPTPFASETTLASVLELQNIAAAIHGGPSQDLDLGRMHVIRGHVYEKCQ